MNIVKKRSYNYLANDTHRYNTFNNNTFNIILLVYPCSYPRVWKSQLSCRIAWNSWLIIIKKYPLHNDVKRYLYSLYTYLKLLKVTNTVDLLFHVKVINNTKIDELTLEVLARWETNDAQNYSQQYHFSVFWKKKA